MKINFFKKRKAEAELWDEKDQSVSELERITSSLAAEVRKSIVKQFDKQMEPYKRKRNALKLDPDAARTIVENLMGYAVTARRGLNGRIAKSLEIGELFDFYYDKMEPIHEMNYKLLTHLDRARNAKEESDRLERLFARVNRQYYINLLEDPVDREKKQEGGGQDE